MNVSAPAALAARIVAAGFPAPSAFRVVLPPDRRPLTQAHPNLIPPSKAVGEGAPLGRLLDGPSFRRSNGRISRHPAMRAIVERNNLERLAASSRGMGRLETKWLASDDNLATLGELPGLWMDRVHENKLARVFILDMDSSKSPTCGAREARRTTALWPQVP